MKLHRGIKFRLDTTSSQAALLEEYCKRYRKLFHIISKKVYDSYLNDKGKLDHPLFDPDKWKSKKKAVRQLLKDEFLQVGLQHEFATHTLLRSVCDQVVQRYTGVKVRKTKNKTTVCKPIGMRQHKACAYNETMLSYKDGILTIPIHGIDTTKDGKKYRQVYIQVKAEPFCKDMVDNLQHLSKKFGGNLMYQKGQWIFVAFYGKDVDDAYEAVDAIAYDGNARVNVNLVFSKPITINGVTSKVLPTSTKIQEILKQLKKFLKNINDTTLTSSQRKYWRRRQINTHKKLEKALIPIADQIIEHVKTNKLCLCIDDAQFGGQMGESGQRINKIISKKCEAQQIPFVLVDSRNTSRTCSECGCCDKRNRVSPEKFVCRQCGLTIHADKNASRVIERRGRNTWFNSTKQDTGE